MSRQTTTNWTGTMTSVLMVRQQSAVQRFRGSDTQGSFGEIVKKKVTRTINRSVQRVTGWFYIGRVATKDDFHHQLIGQISEFLTF